MPPVPAAEMSAADLAAIIVAIASVVAVVLLVLIVVAVNKTLTSLRLTIEQFRRETLPVVDETIADVRRRDEQRFEAQLTGGLTAGRSLMRGNMVTPEPEPYIPPKREAQPLNQETAVVLEEDDARGEAAR